MHLRAERLVYVCVRDAANLDGRYIGAVEERLLRDGAAQGSRRNRSEGEGQPHFPDSSLPRNLAGSPAEHEVEEMFARTKRLMLRPAWREDGATIAALLHSERMVRDLFVHSQECDFAAPCALDACGHEDGLPKLLVFRRTSRAPELIGMVALERHGRRQARLICWIARPHRRSGYGLEAACALLHMAREGLRLDRVLFHERTNARFVRRLGFCGGEMRFSGAGTASADCVLQARAA